MSGLIRFAVYCLPRGPLGRFGAAWLGWDAGVGAVAGPVAGCDPAWVCAAQKYGFHATLKPPFRLAGDRTVAALTEAVAGLAARQAPVTLDGLALSRIGGFLALVPVGDTDRLSALAAACVRDLDAFRAPAPEAEVQRRRAAGLSPAQEAHLRDWGYPFVMDQFRFHMTLTGALGPGARAAAEAVLTRALPPLPRPYRIDDIALMGEGADGMLRLLHRYALTG